MKSGNLALYAGTTFIIVILWSVIAFFTSLITSTIVTAAICSLFAIRYSYEGRHERAYKRQLKFEEKMHSTSANQTIETSEKSQAYYTKEDGYTYTRIKEYELRGLMHRGVDANTFVNSLRYKSSTELEDVKLYLLREPNNADDQWAIKILNSEGLHIGYVQREASEQISNVIIEGKYLEARFAEINYSDVKMTIFHLYSDGNDDDMDELMDYDRIAELEQEYLERQRILNSNPRITKKQPKHRTMKKFDFVALDFENADHDQYACALGLVAVKDGEIVVQKDWLIKPPENRYGKFQMMKHGIKPAHTENAPEFPEFYNEIAQLLNGEMLVAHNYSADKAILNKTCCYYGLPEIEPYKWACTYKLLGKRLNECCCEFDIELKHHDALSDAVACAKLFMLCLSNPSMVKEETLKPRTKSTYVKVSSKTLTAPNLDSINNKDSRFFGQKVIITGKTITNREELAVMMRNLGADFQSSISKNTNIVVIGDSPGPSKMQKIQNLKDAGVQIQVITEQEALSEIQDYVSSENMPVNVEDVQPMPAAATKKFSVNGKRVVVTGAFETTTQDELVERFYRLGAYHRKTVTDNVDFVVIGSKPDPRIISAIEELKKEAVFIDTYNEVEILELLERFEQN